MDDKKKISDEKENLIEEELIQLAKNGNIKEVKNLIEKGVNVNFYENSPHSEYRYPIHYVVMNSAFTADDLEFFIRNGKDIKLNVKDRMLFTPLHYADTIEKAKILLDYGIDPNEVNMYGKTPQDYCSYGREVCEYIASRNKHSFNNINISFGYNTRVSNKINF